MPEKIEKISDELLARYFDGLANEDEKRLVKAYLLSDEKAMNEAVEASRAIAYQKMAAEKFSDLAYDIFVKRLVKDGIIDGNARRKRRLAYFSALFATFVISFAIGWHIFAPINLKINVVEDVNYVIPSMPFESGMIIYSIDGCESVKKTVSDENTTVLVENILFKDKWKKMHLVFESHGYQTVDTIVDVAKSVSLPLRRDNSLGVIFGSVIDEEGKPVVGAKIIVQDIETQTDSIGNFRLEIPFSKQMESQRMQISKEGYRIWTGTYRPSQVFGWNVVLKPKPKP